jgi:xanthosine utilization system XapX-like protein
MELRRKLRWKKTKKELLAYGAGLIMIGAVIYMLIQQRIPQN